VEDSPAPTPLELVTRLNRHVFRSTDLMHFVTLFFSILDPRTGEIEYVNAGHNPPLLVAPDGKLLEIEATGIPCGTLEDFPFRTGTTRLEPGGALLLYSDGIPDAENVREEEFGMDRVNAIIDRERMNGAEAIVDTLCHAVDEFVGNHPMIDDLTLLCVHRSK